MYIRFYFGSDGVSSIVGRVTQNKRLSINGRGERKREAREHRKMSYWVGVGGTAMQRSESEREMYREEE